VTDEDQVAADMYTFLTNLFSSYPKLSKLPLFIIGESYAGHYVPAITSFLVQNAKEINVRGMAVGNGFIDPGIQTASFGPFIYSHGLMSASQLNAVQAAVPACQKDIARGDWQSAFNDCGNVLDLSLQYCSDNNGAQCNVYNIYAPCDGPLCYNFDNIVKFLNTPSVQKQLGVSGINWQACDTTPYEYLENDFDRSYLQDIPIVLAAGVPVTIYNGMLDIICNFYGEAAALDSMTWPGQSAFQKAANTTWVASGNTVGTYRTAQGLTYVAVANAGHMVPHGMFLLNSLHRHTQINPPTHSPCLTLSSKTTGESNKHAVLKAIHITQASSGPR
jgi:carboxypeptidase C (cathepsin A)